MVNQAPTGERQAAYANRLSHTDCKEQAEGQQNSCRQQGAPQLRQLVYACFPQERTDRREVALRIRQKVRGKSRSINPHARALRHKKKFCFGDQLDQTSTTQVHERSSSLSKQQRTDGKKKQNK